MLPETPHVALREELRLTSELIRKYLGRECIGLRTPFGYYRGLRDRPDLLEIVRDTGHRFVTSWGRNEQNGNPTPWVQPFAYAEEGFPDLLEIPFQFWLDGIWFDVNGYGEGRAFRPALEGAVDEIAEQDLVFATAFHEWVAVEADEEGTGWIRGLIERARERGVEVTSYADYWPVRRGAAAQDAPEATNDRTRTMRKEGTPMYELDSLRESLLEGELDRATLPAESACDSASRSPPRARCSRPGAARRRRRRSARRRSAAACSCSRATSSRSRSARSARRTTGRSGRS